MLSAGIFCCYVDVRRAAGSVRGPEGEVVPEELHDEGGVLVAVLVQRVQLRYGVVESLKKKPTSCGSGLGEPSKSELTLSYNRAVFFPGLPCQNYC